MIFPRLYLTEYYVLCKKSIIYISTSLELFYAKAAVANEEITESIKHGRNVWLLDMILK